MQASRSRTRLVFAGVGFASLLAFSAVSAQEKVQKLDSADCERIFSEVERWYTSLPATFRVTGEEADAMAVRTSKAMVKATRFVTACGTDPVRTARARLYAAKASFILSARYLKEVQSVLTKDSTLEGKRLHSEIDRRMGDYMGQVQALAKGALDNLPKDDPLRPRALELLASSLHRGQRLDEAEKAYLSFISQYPSDKSVDRMVNALGHAYLDAGRWDEGIKLLETAVRERYRSHSYPYYVDALRKLYISKGDVEGLLATVKRGLTVFPLKAGSSKLPANLRGVYERLEIYYGFWLGYAHMAAGRFDDARVALREHIDSINALEKELAAKSRSLKPEFSIYRGRSDTTLRFLDKAAGRPAPHELDLEWVTDRTLTLGESLGKVVGVLFRNVNNPRSQEFMAAVSQSSADDPDIEMAAVHYLRRSQSAVERGGPLRAELRENGFLGAAGFDPDVEGQQIFRAYGVKIGTPTFVIIDRSGNLVWFMEDPRPIDIEFVRTLLRRVADES